MTDRLSLMHYLEDLVKVLREYKERGYTVESITSIAEGYVRSVRERFEEDNKGGLYGA